MNDYFNRTFCEMVAAQESGTVFHNPSLSADIEHYPRRLYKYRDCLHEYDFEMVEDGYLWADFPNSFDDRTDSFVNFNFSDKDEARVMSLFLDYYNEFVCYSAHLNGIPGENIQVASHDDIEKVRKYGLTKSGKFSDRKYKQFISNAIEVASPEGALLIKNSLDWLEHTMFSTTVEEASKKVLDTLVQHFRQRCKICCLTERKDNQKMWEDYASKYSGFAIEYDVCKCIGNKSAETAISNMFKVSYYKHMPSVPLYSVLKMWLFSVIGQRDPDAFETSKALYQQIFIKKHEYNPEEEWRILSSVNKIDFSLISAVYMGCKISEENEARLKTICFKHNIPLYKQQFRRFSNKMDFVLIKNEVQPNERNEEQRD